MALTSELRTVDYDEAAAAAALPAATRLGPVHLTVSDLARSVPFYEDVVGLSEQWRGRTAAEEPAVALGSDGAEPVVVLVEQPTATPPRRTSGLYHVALRYPTQASLGHLIRRIVETRTPIQGASDHGTHEAIYLPDPDGNGLELEWDRRGRCGRRWLRSSLAGARRHSTSTRPSPRPAAPRLSRAPRGSTWATCTCTSDQ